MRQYAIAVLAVFVLSCSAYGADIPLKAPETSPPYNWTGFYAGAHLDYQAGLSRWSPSQVGALGAAGVFDLGKGYVFSSGTGSYAIGFQGRYDYMDASHHVFGVEGDIWFPNTLSGGQTFTTAAVGSAIFRNGATLGHPSWTARICGRELAILSHRRFRLEFRSVRPHAKHRRPGYKRYGKWDRRNTVLGTQIRRSSWCGNRRCPE
jgi:high affinity Mn2+ porin